MIKCRDMVDLKRCMDERCGQICRPSDRDVSDADLMGEDGDVHGLHTMDVRKNLRDICNTRGAMNVADEEYALEKLGILKNRSMSG